MKKRIPPKARKAVKIAIIALLCLLCLKTVWWGVFVFYPISRPDIPPFDDSLMILKKPRLSDAENGYIELSTMFGDCTKPPQPDKLKVSDVNRKPTDKQAAFLESRFGKYLDGIDRVLDKKTIVVPAQPITLCENCENKEQRDIEKTMQCFIRLKNTNLTLAWRDVNNANTDSAVRRIELTLRFGNALENAYGGTGWYFLGASIISKTESEINSMLDRGLLKNEDFEKLSMLLNKYAAPSDEGWRNAMREQYEFQKALRKESYASFSYSRFWPLRMKEQLEIKANYKENMTNKIWFDVDSELNRQPDVKYSDAFRNRVSGLAKIYCDSSWIETNKRALRGNFISEVLFCISVYNFTHVGVSYYLFAEKTTALETKIALLRYRSDHGRFPESLNELTPDYLNAIPMDPISREPMKYNTKKNVVYSIGFNMKDDGGDSKLGIFEKNTTDIMKEKDLVLKVLP